MRVRGLKQLLLYRLWKGRMSHPVRVRGLKPSSRTSSTVCIRSHPVRVRGLKPGLLCPGYQRGSVAPRAGAWVETDTGISQAEAIRCRTPCGCVG